MSDGLRQWARVSAEAVYPVAVAVRVTGSGPRARWARTPSTYSCRVLSSPAGAGAAHSPGAARDGRQPVTRRPPLSTVRRAALPDDAVSVAAGVAGVQDERPAEPVDARARGAR